MLRVADRVRYRKRITELLNSPPTETAGKLGEFEYRAQWAKHLCVLVSGYLEQAIREIFVATSSSNASPKIARYVEQTWPKSKNMNCGNIAEILAQFDQSWSRRFNEWIEEDEQRKQKINNVVRWRNDIAHGKEANTTGVTLHSVSECFKCACSLVDLLEVFISEASAK